MHSEFPICLWTIHLWKLPCGYYCNLWLSFVLCVSIASCIQILNIYCPILLFCENYNMQHFRMTNNPRCLPTRRRNIDSYKLDERQASGETVIPGTNATAQDVADTFDRITDKLDMIQVSADMNNPS